MFSIGDCSRLHKEILPVFSIKKAIATISVGLEYET
jgi:hypothetical protein